jgi:hypothetical protein
MLKVLTNTKKQWLAKWTEPFVLQEGILYIMDQNNIFWCYVAIEEAHKILWELHEGFGGGHFVANIIAKKIFDVGYWWPTLSHDATKYYTSYDACQKARSLIT